MKSDIVYLQHMLEAISRIVTYLGDTGRTGFDADQMLQDAIIRQLQVIGEATRSLSPEFKQNHPELPWFHMIGMRNRIIHEYFRVDLEIVWEVVQNDLGMIAEQITKILADLQQSGK